MNSGSRSVFLSLVAAFALAGCGGGGDTVYTTGVTSGTAVPISVSPTALQFTSPASAAQTFTISSTTSGATAPVVDGSTCTINGQTLVTITGGGGVLPATYTVTPNAAFKPVAGAPAGSYGTCTAVFTSGTSTATLPILVGTTPTGPLTISASPTSLTFTAVGAANQTFTITASAGTGPGTVSLNTTACNAIATVTGAGGVPPQTFTVTPIGIGGCSVVAVDGEETTIVPISVAQTSAAAALTLNPTSLTFTAPNAAPQSVTIGFSGYVGQVSVDQSQCAGIATFTVPNGSLPQTSTVTPVAVGTCAIVFSATNAAPQTLTITVQ